MKIRLFFVTLTLLLSSALAAKPLLVIVAVEDEYKTVESLPKLCNSDLAEDFEIAVVAVDPKNRNKLGENWERIQDADVLMLSLHRRALPAEQLNAIKQHVKTGKPLVAVRTVSHGFSMRKKQKEPAGHLVWDDFDGSILGGTYHGHEGKSGGTSVQINPDAKDDPILKGVDAKFQVTSWLYNVKPLAADCRVLLTGRAASGTTEPVAWTRTLKSGSRVFYCSLGHPKDFDVRSVRRTFVNATKEVARAKK